jgi:hypothetical protein
MSDPVEELEQADEELEEAKQGKRSVADQLVALVNAEAQLFHDPDDTPYAVIKRDGIEQTWRLRSKRFKAWLSLRHREEYDKTPGSQAVADALNELEGEALHRGDVEEVYVRVAGGERRRVYLDLADEDWSAVLITPDGWDVVARPAVRFRRPAGMLPLPRPSSGRGELDELRGLLNIDDDDDWLLTVGWLLAALMPGGPFPIKELVGEAGSAKSTHARLARAVVDPTSSPLRRPPREARDLMIGASNNWVVAFDNMTDLSDWLADDLCRLATGGGFATRTLFSDDDETIFNAMRPIVLTGIGGVGDDRNDLPDRTLRIRKPRIPKSRRRKEEDVVAAFERIRASVLGTLLDAVAVALGTVHGIEFGELPRMADAAAWIEAAGAEFGWERGDFLAAYDGAHARAHELAVESSLVGPPLVEVAFDGGFVGSPTELLDAITAKVDEQVTRRKEWPKNAAVFGKQLRRLAPDLRGLGATVELDQEPGSRGGGRTVHLGGSEPQSAAAADARVAQGGRGDSSGGSDGNSPLRSSDIDDTDTGCSP